MDCDLKANDLVKCVSNEPPADAPDFKFCPNHPMPKIGAFYTVEKVLADDDCTGTAPGWEATVELVEVKGTCTDCGGTWMVYPHGWFKKADPNRGLLDLSTSNGRTLEDVIRGIFGVSA